jgi:hypothetical protein
VFGEDPLGPYDEPLALRGQALEVVLAQLTHRWGSRHTSEGKTIWAELGLLDEE